MQRSVNALWSLSRVVALPLRGVLWVYQHTLSPDHSWVRHRYPGGYCRFAPTCSSYAVHALRKDGVVALPAIVWRVARCHPWNAGGIDPYLALSQDAVLRPKP